MADPQISDDSSSGEAEEMQEVVIGDTTIRREEHILDRTGQNIGDPETELADLSPDLLEVDYTNTRLRKLPPLKHLHQVEVRCIFGLPPLPKRSLTSTHDDRASIFVRTCCSIQTSKICSF